jgi:hypothetical protein
MITFSSPATAGVQTPEEPISSYLQQELLRFACNDWAPAFAGEQEPS